MVHAKNQNGFTLIELVVVIILLGILAITALPRFVNLSSEANTAVLNNLVTNIRSTTSLQHMHAQLQTGGLENGYVSPTGVFFDKGYPIGISFGDSDGIPEILEALNLNFSDYTYNTIFTGAGSAGSVTRDLYITTRNVISNGASPAQIIATNCYVAFKSYVLVSIEPDILILTSGC